MIDKKILLKAQQGELDAVVMYQMLEKRYNEPKVKETFKLLALEEGKHASVFHNLTGETLKPNDSQGKMLVTISKVIPKKILFRLIAVGEYNAVKTYQPVVDEIPEVKEVQADEKRHGDIMKELSKKI